MFNCTSTFFFLISIYLIFFFFYRNKVDKRKCYLFSKQFMGINNKLLNNNYYNVEVKVRIWNYLCSVLIIIIIVFDNLMRIQIRPLNVRKIKKKKKTINNERVTAEFWTFIFPWRNGKQIIFKHNNCINLVNTFLIFYYCRSFEV